MELLDETLSERVDDVIRSHKCLLLSTTGSQAALAELVRRSEGLEQAIREVALEVEKLAAWQKRRAPTPPPARRPSTRC